jgi:hypothetical protein
MCAEAFAERARRELQATGETGRSLPQFIGDLLVSKALLFAIQS